MDTKKYNVNVAEVAADYYLATQRSGGLVDLSAEGVAREDFIAGFEAAEARLQNLAETWSADREFVIQQLYVCLEHAEREGEFYSASILRTVIKKLGYEAD